MDKVDLEESLVTTRVYTSEDTLTFSEAFVRSIKVLNLNQLLLLNND